jgi:hypothetical protein
MSSLQTLGMSAALGAILAASTIFIGWWALLYSLPINSLFWIGLPIIGYGISIGLNSIFQLSKCGKVNMIQLATGNIVVPLAILAFLGLTMLSIVRSPIDSALTPQIRYTYGKIIPIAFYMFWAGMFGEAVASGFAQSCGS